MEIVSAYDIASANLAVALSDNVVSTEHRQAMTEAVGENLDNMIDALNTVVSAYNRMVYEGRYQAEKAPLAVKAEYREMGFNKIVNYRFLMALSNCSTTERTSRRKIRWIASRPSLRSIPNAHAPG